MLWDGCPPDGARRVIQTYMARLRGRLASCGVQITAGSGGYRIDVPPGDIDVHRFRAAVTLAQQAKDDASRAAALAAALDLWQGPVLGDVASGQLRDRVGTAFEEARLAAVEQCATCYLAAGQPDRAIMIVATAPDRPVREHLVGLRMTALAAAGRKSEALAAYRSARTALAADLGLEPGPELRLLHDQVLRSDSQPPGRPGPSPQRADQDATIPRELPPVVSVFTGRAGQRGQIAEALAGAAHVPDGRTRAIVIHGRGGTGKSALAVQVAHDVSGRFPDGQVYIDLCGSTPGLTPRTATSALRHCLRSLGVPAHDIPRHPAEAAARLRTLVTGKRILFILDNTTSAVTVEPLLPASGGSAVIVTGRAALPTLDALAQIELSGLSQDESRLLVTAIAGPVRGPSGVLDQIIDSCERLPLALRIAASRLASDSGLSAQRLADRLSDQRSRLDELDIDGLAVRTSVQVSLDALRDSHDRADRLAAALLPWLVVLPVPGMTAELAADVAGRAEVADVRTALRRLAALHLVYFVDDQRYGLHDLIRLYAIELKASMLTAGERDRGAERGFGHYLALGYRVCEILTPGRHKPGVTLEPLAGPQAADLRTAEHANHWLDGEITNVIAAAEHAVAMPGDQAMFAFHAAHALHWLLGKRAAWLQELALARLAGTATAAHGSLAQRMDALTMRGQAELHLGRLADARTHLQQAAELGEHSGERERQVAVLGDLACVAMSGGDHEQARDQLERALLITRNEGWAQREAILLLNLSSVHVECREWTQGHRALERSLSIRRQSGDIAGLAIVLPAMGYLCLELGRETAARQHLDEAIEVCEQVGNDVDRWFAFLARSVLHLNSGAIRPALRDAVAAARLCTDARPYESAATLRLLAAVSRAAGRERKPAEFDQLADAAYAAFAGRRIPDVEALLRRAARS